MPRRPSSKAASPISRSLQQRCLTWQGGKALRLYEVISTSTEKKDVHKKVSGMQRPSYKVSRQAPRKERKNFTQSGQVYASFLGTPSPGPLIFYSVYRLFLPNDDGGAIMAQFFSIPVPREGGSFCKAKSLCTWVRQVRQARPLSVFLSRDDTSMRLYFSYD